jgi:ribosomal protein S18 acetylase RimI-like enzyme
MEIIAATENDIPAIQQIAYETWPTTYGEILSPEQLKYMLGLMYSQETLAKQMQDGHCFFMAKADEKTIGFAGISPTEKPARWKLQKLYVVPTTQQKGTGKTLLAFVENYVKKVGATDFSLQVNRNNNAKSFYEKMGFTIESSADFDIGEGYWMNDFVMVKQL